MSAPPEFSSSAASLHHRREHDERAGVYRHHHEDECGKYQPRDDEYPAQQPGVGCVVDLTAWPNFVHDGGLPSHGLWHTSSATGYRSGSG